MRGLKDRTAIVTGASRGLGTYIARALALEEMNLVLAARSASELEEVAADLRRGGCRVLAIPTDLANPPALETLVAGALREFGTVDILVNNAAHVMLTPYHQLPLDEVEQAVNVNLTAPMLLTRMVLPAMLAQRRGHIVNISSVGGKIGGAYLEAYCATKAGLAVFTAALRASCRSTGVSASVIFPGLVSEAGFYHRIQTDTGVRTPPLFGSSTPNQVAQAVLRALRHDLPEIILNPLPVRTLLALQAIAPRLVERIFALSGGSVYRKAGQIYERRARQGSLPD